MSKTFRSKRGSRGYRDRSIETRNERQSFLIICEGEKTEPNYFRSFRARGWVPDVRGLGENTIALVEKAVYLMAQREYDHVWCVFDRDQFLPKDFNAAIALADQHGIKIAYSNESFELWYVLHFNYCDVAMHRSDYCKKLDSLLGHPYKKESPAIYDELYPRQPVAIRNAELLFSRSSGNPITDNPSTTVHRLVLELNDNIA